MELDDLKTIWKQNGPEFRQKGEAEISLMLKRKSISIIARLKRNIWFELIIAVLSSFALLLYAIGLKNGALKWSSISILLMTLGASVYFVKKLSLLNRFEEMNENLHDSLALLISNLNSYLKFYKNSYAILFPIYFFLALLFGALERGPAKYLEFILQTSVIIYLLAVAVLFFVTSTWAANWYINKLYGDHLAKLQGLLDDLNN